MCAWLLKSKGMRSMLLPLSPAIQVDLVGPGRGPVVVGS